MTSTHPFELLIQPACPVLFPPPSASIEVPIRNVVQSKPFMMGLPRFDACVTYETRLRRGLDATATPGDPPERPDADRDGDDVDRHTGQFHPEVGPEAEPERVRSPEGIVDESDRRRQATRERSHDNHEGGRVRGESTVPPVTGDQPEVVGIHGGGEGRHEQGGRDRIDEEVRVVVPGDEDPEAPEGDPRGDVARSSILRET